MPITTKMDNKVVASTQVSRPHPEIQNNPLNADLGRNPSQANGNSPPIVPRMRDAFGSPEWPMRQKSDFK